MSSSTTTPKKRSQPTSRRVVESPYSKVKHVLTSAIDDCVVGRDEEYRRIYSLLEADLQQDKSQAFYISGPAGTGKSLTVGTVLKKLKTEHAFKLIDINCMHFGNEQNFCEQILGEYQQRKAKRTRRGDANKDTFVEMKEAIAAYEHMTILVLDEIDQIETRNYELLRNIFKLPSVLKGKLILIGIANSLDLTTKLTQLKEISSRNFHKIRFLPYTKDQIVAIIESRLKNFIDDENVFIDKMAINYCASKISSCSGDIRKALDVCRRSIELLENNLNPTPATTSLTPLKSTTNKKQPPPVSPSKAVDLRCMMSTLNKVFGTAPEKLDEGAKVFLPSDQQVILATLLILLKTKQQRQVSLGDCRQALLKVCERKSIAFDSKSESEILNMCHLLADYGYVSILNEAAQTSLGTSPFKKTPRKTGGVGSAATSKKNVTLISLKLDPFEAEQLLSTFHRGLVNGGIDLN